MSDACYAVSAWCSARYQLLTNEELAAQSFQLFRGLPEDRFVSAFLDPTPHSSAEAIAGLPDRVADAIEVLRTSSMSTYENRRIATGVLLFGSMPEPCHVPPQTPPQEPAKASSTNVGRWGDVSEWRDSPGGRCPAIVVMTGMYFLHINFKNRWSTICPLKTGASGGRDLPFCARLKCLRCSSKAAFFPILLNRKKSPTQSIVISWPQPLYRECWLINTLSNHKIIDHYETVH